MRSEIERSPFEAPDADLSFRRRFRRSALATHNLAFSITFVALMAVSLSFRTTPNYTFVSSSVELRGVPPWLEVAEGRYIDQQTGATFSAKTISSVNWLPCAVNLIFITILSAVVRRYVSGRH